MPRIAVFTGSLSYSVRKGIIAIDEAVPNAEWLIVLHSPRKGARVLVRNQWRNFMRNGWRWIPYQAGDIRRRLGGGGAEEVPRNLPGGAYTLKALRARANVRLISPGSIHCSEAVEAVRHFAPDLGLSLAAPILHPSIFAVPRLGTLNLHKGRVPDYRGMPPAFWELWNDEKSVGCTVHWIGEGLDTGDVVAQTQVARQVHSNLHGLQLQLEDLGIALMRDAVVDVLRGTSRRSPQPVGGNTYRKPTLAQEEMLARRLRGPKRGVVGRAKAVARRGMLSVVRAGNAVGMRHVLMPRITVLLYHRVSDTARDNLTVGIAQFDRQMSLLREHCQPLSIEEVLAATDIPASGRPLVAVTFDDGYRDNYDYAAPILERNGIPAAFFVSTGIVDSGNRFPHDVRRGNAEIPVMTWDQLRDMRARRFTIGSHSVFHIDCAAEAEERVREELAHSRDDLVRELGAEELIFAYPYGGRQHMTPTRLELVKQAGYVGCLSAYGGTNVGKVDRFNVLRCGIQWEFDDVAFMLRCQGLS